MDEKTEQVMEQAAQASAETQALIGRLLEVAEPDAIYSNRIQEGNYTVITASELVVGMGVGSGGGFGPGTMAEDSEPMESGGYGSGGGGFSHARPVATITVGPDGVTVTPIIDTTKLGIAFLTSMAAVLLTLIRIRGTVLSSR